MSAAMVKAHGGSKDLVTSSGSMAMSGIIRDTMVGAPTDIKEKHLDRLISRTTGVPMNKPVMDGVIQKTTSGGSDVPEYHKVPAKEVGKTQAKRMGQVPYAGKKY
jgi:hypothetical protein